MSHENEVDLTRLGSGLHESVIGDRFGYEHPGIENGVNGNEKETIKIGGNHEIVFKFTRLTEQPGPVTVEPGSGYTADHTIA